jgi:hypothetical protein
MAPHQNTRSHHQPLTAPLPPPIRRRAAAPAGPPGTSVLPPELRMMVWEASNEGDRNNELTLACRPENQGRARRGHLWLISGLFRLGSRCRLPFQYHTRQLRGVDRPSRRFLSKKESFLVGHLRHSERSRRRSG